MYNGESITLLYVNEAHEKFLQSMGIWKSTTGNRQLHAANFPQWDKVRAFLDRSTVSSRKSSMIYGYGSQYFRLCIRKLAEANGQYLCQGELYNVTADQKKQETNCEL